MLLYKLTEDMLFNKLALLAVAAFPVVFWLNVGQVKVPVLKLPD